MSGGSERGADERFAELDKRFTELMMQLEACGCGPRRAVLAHGDGDGGISQACQHVVENLFEFLDHEMPERLEELMAEHTRHCDECGSAVEAELRFRRMLKRSCSAQAPEALRIRISQISAQFRA